MRQWLNKWRDKRRQRNESKRLGGRLLFAYWDGSQERFADPFLVWRELLKKEPVDILASWDAAMAGQEPVTQQVLDGICRIFTVQPWDEATKIGLTGWELLALVQAFEFFVLDLKKNGSAGQTSLPPTESTSSIAPADQPAATENVSSDSHSTPEESIPVAAS